MGAGPATLIEPIEMRANPAEQRFSSGRTPAGNTPLYQDGSGAGPQILDLFESAS